MNPDAARIADALLAAESAVALTGAGVSTPSGIPDFRSEGGVWERYEESDFTIWRFEQDPEAFWTDWLDLYELFGGSEVAPNAAHEALAELEDAGVLETIITQNVDGLHRAAGAQEVVSLHGDGSRATCQDCGRGLAMEAVIEDLRTLPPYCPDCGGVLKPDTVLFGEELPAEALETAREAVEAAGALLVVGSSLVVDPAGQLPRRALEWEATLIVCNLQPTPYKEEADVVVREPLESLLPRILEAVRDRG